MCSPVTDIIHTARQLNTIEDDRKLKMNPAIQIVSSKLHEVGPFIQQQLKGGISGDEVVLVSTPTSRFVVRSFPHKSASQRSREISCFRIASESGYGPHVYYFDVEQGILVMECLEKHILSDEQRESDSLYIDLAHLIQRIHRGPSFPTNVNINRIMPRKCLEFESGEAGGFIFNGYLTQAELIFESRAV